MYDDIVNNALMYIRSRPKKEIKAWIENLEAIEDILYITLKNIHAGDDDDDFFDDLDVMVLAWMIKQGEG